MAKRMLIDALHPEETRVAIADEKQIYDFDFVSAAKKQHKGNIYLAKITRVEPSLQAAFVEYGGNKQGFLPFSEIHPDYYQIPVSDRKRLMEEAEREVVQEQAYPAAEPSTQAEEPPADMAAEPAPVQEDSAGSSEQPPEHPAYLAQGAIDFPAEDSAAEESPVTEIPANELAADIAETTDAAAGEIPEAAPASEEKPAEEGMETLPNEEEELRDKRKKRTFFKRYRIQEVIRRGQVVLVQVIKEERGNKGVSLTTYLSLPGRYCVLMPNSPKDGGVSRKIASPEDRKRLKAIYTELKLAAGMSVIIRTAGMDRTRAEIKRDYEYLVKLWNQIREDTLKSNAPAVIYKESDIIKRAIRDQYSNDIDEIVIEGEDGYRAAKEFMKMLLPSHTPKIKQYKEATPLFYAYNIEDQLLEMHDPVVKLRSGGYIVINPTEALISIDVNSGRATGERNIEETATKTNLEAAAEVARQLRLRDLAGLIVIDFIDMLESRNRRNVERALKDALKADRAKIQLGRISPFGLLEMSRQRLRPSISETNMVQCPHCAGRGYIRSNESMSIQIIRALEKEAATGAWSGFRLIAPQPVALHLLNTKRTALKSIEERHGVSIQVLVDMDLALSEFNLEKMRRAQNQANDQRRKRRSESEPQAQTMEAMPAETVAEEDAQPLEANTAGEESRSDIPEGDDRGGSRRGRRGRRGRRRGGRDHNPAPQEPADVSAPPEEGLSSPAEEERGGRRQRGRRGGRRRWRDQPSPERNSVFPQAGRDDRESRTPPKLVSDNHDVPSDGNALPAFTRQDPVPEEPRRAAAAAAPVVPESTPRDPNTPPKKGWWQKMIDLDD